MTSHGQDVLRILPLKALARCNDAIESSNAPHCPRSRGEHCNRPDRVTVGQTCLNSEDECHYYPAKTWLTRKPNPISTTRYTSRSLVEGIRHDHDPEFQDVHRAGALRHYCDSCPLHLRDAHGV